MSQTPKTGQLGRKITHGDTVKRIPAPRNPKAVNVMGKDMSREPMNDGDD